MQGNYYQLIYLIIYLFSELHIVHVYFYRVSTVVYSTHFLVNRVASVCAANQLFAISSHTQAAPRE